MNEGKLFFSQLLFFLPKRQFRRIVERYQGNYNVKKFTCWDQFICMMFAQLTQRESLRDILSDIEFFQKKLNKSLTAFKLLAQFSQSIFFNPLQNLAILHNFTPKE